LIPILNEYSSTELSTGKNPEIIINEFFKNHTDFKTEKEKHDFLFKIIQYTERQVVLIDAIEDAFFSKINNVKGNGTIDSVFNKLEDPKLALKQIKINLKKFSSRIVLTAHPTQFYPSRVLGIIDDLKQKIVQNDPSAVRDVLIQLGWTPFFKKRKPSPIKEATKLVWYLENVFFDVSSSLIENLRKHVKADIIKDDVISIGFWPGGDRDGNPYVVNETTRKVASLLRDSIINLYIEQVKNIRKKITFSGIYEKLELIEFRLVQHLNNKESFKIEIFKRNLKNIKQKLINEYGGTFVDRIEDLLNKVRLFGYYFASIDIRQNRNEIKRALKFVEIKNRTPLEMHAHELLSFSGKIKLKKVKDKTIKDTLYSFKMINEIQKKYGESICNRYIISNCCAPEDIASAYFLAKQTAFKQSIKVDFIPLFESVQDLDNAQHILEVLFSEKNYMSHLKKRKNTQTIMLGFSDGTKDGGYITANWKILQARKKIINLSKKYKVDIIFFDGRGGPPARGGGETHDYYTSLKKTTMGSQIQLTIQGQTVSSKFGNPVSAKYNLEQLLSSGLHVLTKKENQETEEFNRLMNQLSKISLNKYLKLIKRNDFMDYMSKVTPLNYYQRANISSRPDRRDKNSKSISDLRAIPFVGAWSQIRQNVPGYYGLGTAIKHIIDLENEKSLKKMYLEHDFFQAIIENSMQSMVKTNFNKSLFLRREPQFNAIWEDVKKEFELTKQMVLKVSGQKTLLEKKPQIKSSIKLRERIVSPLILIQQYALYKKREGKKKKSNVYDSLIIRSLFGNINAARNSA
jgi:phosphoenolpyruvate carboxylase